MKMKNELLLKKIERFNELESKQCNIKEAIEHGKLLKEIEKELKRLAKLDYTDAKREFISEYKYCPIIVKIYLKHKTYTEIKQEYMFMDRNDRMDEKIFAKKNAKKEEKAIPKGQNKRIKEKP
jgi:hypothetical protein